jgi:hypothetical protein
MFTVVKKQLQDNFRKMLSLSEHLFYVTIDRDTIFELYIQGFEEEESQSHNCNCCKSFLRQYGGIVSIINGKRVSIWDDLEVPKEYEDSISALKEYIHKLPITDVFVNDTVKCGTDRNHDSVRDVYWNHFYLELPSKFVKKADTLDALRGEKRTAKEMLQRALTELTTDSVDTVLDLVAQNSLYRGKDYEGVLKAFSKLQKEYKAIADTIGFSDLVENFFWIKSVETAESISKIRNTAIGTLLINLSENMELDMAVSKFEQVVAPANYKRPTALVTPKMIELAKEKLNELGLMESLDRRYANETDLSTEDILFTDKSTTSTDVFADMSKDIVVNPKTLSKVEEISITDFIEKVIPTSKSIEVLVENSHLGNLVSLITSSDKNAKSLFKWDNNFSWSYSGGITDSLKEKVAKLGGRVDGVFRFSHSWNELEPNQSLMDLHVFMPKCELPKQFSGGPSVTGRRVGWNQRTDSLSGGNQDVDYTSEAPKGYIPVENITFPAVSKMPEGVYTCMIHNWSYRGSGGKGKAEIEVGGTVYEYEYPRTKNHEWITVAEVTLKAGEFTIKHLLPESTNTVSKEKWGIKTNQFTKVNKVMLSPNYWGKNIGNKHFMFLLDGCVSDETARPFFNEFLKPEFDENRKVFEIMGGKMKIEDNPYQLSGVGFSETQRNHLIVKVDGSFKRTLKINF